MTDQRDTDVSRDTEPCDPPADVRDTLLGMPAFERPEREPILPPDPGRRCDVSLPIGIFGPPSKRLLRRIVNRLAQVIMLAAGPSDADFVRAGGDCICPVCGENYYRHAVDPFARWVTVLCDGYRVKL